MIINILYSTHIRMLITLQDFPEDDTLTSLRYLNSLLQLNFYKDSVFLRRCLHLSALFSQSVSEAFSDARNRQTLTRDLKS